MPTTELTANEKHTILISRKKGDAEVVKKRKGTTIRNQEEDVYTSRSNFSKRSNTSVDENEALSIQLELQETARINHLRAKIPRKRKQPLRNARVHAEDLIESSKVKEKVWMDAQEVVRQAKKRKLIQLQQSSAQEKKNSKIRFEPIQPEEYSAESSSTNIGQNFNPPSSGGQDEFRRAPVDIHNSFPEPLDPPCNVRRRELRTSKRLEIDQLQADCSTPLTNDEDEGIDLAILEDDGEVYTLEDEIYGRSDVDDEVNDEAFDSDESALTELSEDDSEGYNSEDDYKSYIDDSVNALDQNMDSQSTEIQLDDDANQTHTGDTQETGRKCSNKRPRTRSNTANPDCCIICFDPLRSIKERSLTEGLDPDLGIWVCDNCKCRSCIECSITLITIGDDTQRSRTLKRNPKCPICRYRWSAFDVLAMAKKYDPITYP